MELNSQRVRALAPENDPLKIGMGWKVEDLDKPQIMVESTFGDSHPGSAHLDQLVNEAMRGIADAGGKGARYFTTDICDGIAQGHDGINYSLAHRDMIANMIEIHGNSTGFDGGVSILRCLFLHGYRLHHADHGRITGSDASRLCADAGNLRGPEGNGI